MALKTILLVFVLAFSVAADDLEKTQKKQLEGQVKTMTSEAKKLESMGQLAEARAKYAESQALIEMKEVTEAIKHLDEQIEKRVKDTLSGSRKLYESHKYTEAAAALDEGTKLQAFQSVMAYDLALCYYQLGDRNKALEYLQKAKSATADPKQKQKLLQLLTFFTTGESALPLKDSDKDRITQVNLLSESVGLEASSKMRKEKSRRFSGLKIHRRSRCPRRLPRQIHRAPRISAPSRVTGPVCAMRLATSRARWLTVRRQHSISRIARKPMGALRRRRVCSKNIFKWPPPRSMSMKLTTESPN